MTDDISFTRGGKRVGAGRKKTPIHLKRMRYTVRLPNWLITWLQSQSQSQGKLVEKALLETYNLTPPDDEQA